MSDQKSESPEAQNPELSEAQAPDTATPNQAAGGAAPAEWAERLAGLESQLAAAREGEVRALAEQQNIQRRADLDVQKARKFAVERLVTDLLPVLDNLERAMQSMAGGDAAQQAVFEGIDLTHTSFLAPLQSQGVEVVDPQAEPFNPDQHQAISIQVQADAEPNTVLQVIQKGYLLNGRLLRPAMVVVSKSAS